jgi:hypothetical protein
VISTLDGIAAGSGVEFSSGPGKINKVTQADQAIHFEPRPPRLE